MKLKTFSSMFLVGLGISVAAGGAETEDVIKYRQATMSAIGGHMGAIAAIVRNKAGQQEHLLPHAMALEETSKTASDIFPEGSGQGETDALPVIWEKPDEFQQAIEKLTTSASAFREAVEDGDEAQIGPALKELGGACKNCHDDFRKEK